MSRREEIISAAIKCLGQNGVQKTNGHSVAKEMGIRPSNVTYYFATSEALLAAMVEHIVQTNQSIVNPMLIAATSRMNEVEAYLDGNLKWVQKHPDHFAVLMAGFMEAPRRKPLGVLVNAALDAGTERLYSIIAKGVVEGSLKGKVNSHETAKILHHLLVGALVRFFTEAGDSVDTYRMRLFVLARELLQPTESI